MAYDSYETTSEHHDDHVVVREMPLTHLQSNVVTAPAAAVITREMNTEAQVLVYPKSGVYSVTMVRMQDGSVPHMIQQPIQLQAHVYGLPNQLRGAS